MPVMKPPPPSKPKRLARELAPLVTAGNEEEATFRIQAVAEIAGVPAATLRAWERRYGVPKPKRTSSAYRLYSAEDIERVRSMQRLCEAGLSAAEAARTVLGKHPVLAPPPEPANAIDVARERILRAAASFDAPRLDAELMRVAYAGDATSVYERVVAPLLIEVGDLWAAGEVSVAQEHFLSERLEVMLRNALTIMRPERGERVLLACVSGEYHVLGLLGAALHFTGLGVQPVLLGADTPPEAIADASHKLQPKLIGLSSTRMPTRPKSLFEQYAAATAGAPWLVGGAAATELAPIIEQLGGVVAGGESWSNVVIDMLHAAKGKRRTKESS